MFLFLLTSCFNEPEKKTENGDGEQVESVNPWDELEAVYGIANRDDDNENGSADWLDGLVDEEDDLATLIIPSGITDALEDGQELELTLNDDEFRIYEDGGIELENAGDSFTITSGSEIQVEFSSFNAKGSATLTLLENGSEEKSATIHLYASPLMVNHHLQPAETVFVMKINGNRDFVNGFQDVIGDDLVDFPLNSYEYDVWIQDEMEFAVFSSPEQRVDFLWDSIRDRGLDPLPETFEDPNFIVETYGSGWATSQDSFGNLEASPPVTVDGKHYPFGRAYYGKWGNERLHEEMRDLLDSQEIQAPVEIDVEWLCVGHVDEFVSFIPDPTAPQGFRMLVADVNKAYEFLESIEDVSLPKYSFHGVGSSTEILEERSLRTLNEELQEIYIEPNIEIFKEEFGITEEEIIRVPSLFEEVSGCYGTNAALIPGTVNMVVFTSEDGKSAELFTADPFFRGSNQSQSEDVFIQHVESLLPSSVTTHWIDDWDWYHEGLGEVHCGSNVLRSPSTEAWIKAHQQSEAE